MYRLRKSSFACLTHKIRVVYMFSPLNFRFSLYISWWRPIDHLMWRSSAAHSQYSTDCVHLCEDNTDITHSTGRNMIKVTEIKYLQYHTGQYLDGCWLIADWVWGNAVQNWPNSQIPQCIYPISHDAPFRTEMWTFRFWMVYCGIWNKCIVAFVKLVYWFNIHVYTLVQSNRNFVFNV